AKPLQRHYAPRRIKGEGVCMAKLSTSQIREMARKVIALRPGGIRYSELVNEISRQSPDTPINTVHGSTWDLATRFPTEIVKPSRGLFQPASAQAAASTPALE